MSQENVEVVRKLYELQWTPEALELLDPQLIDAGGDQVVVVSRVIGTGVQ